MKIWRRFLCVTILLFSFFGIAYGDTIFIEDFEDNLGFTTSGNANYWDVASLDGTLSYPSSFTQGGSQSGQIFYGVNGYDSTATLEIALPDLTWYKNLELSVSLAAPDGTRWESTHRDSLYLYGSTGEIDAFLPTARGAPLQSQVWSLDLGYQFQDFMYEIDNSLTSLSFVFASTANDEFIGIDSITISGDAACAPVPEPSTMLLLGSGLTGLAWYRRRKKE